LLLAEGDTGHSTTKQGIASKANFNKYPRSSITHDEINFTTTAGNIRCLKR
jgi:hypothetical protein